METGKVELSVERYEELRTLERGESTKIKALEEELQKARDGRLLMKKVITKYGWCNEVLTTEYSYITKDEVIQGLDEIISSKEQEVTRLHEAIKGKPFVERLKYLFTKELSV